MAEKVVLESLTSSSPTKQIDYEEESIIQAFPLEKTWNGTILQQYQGIWYPATKVTPRTIMIIQNHFLARDTDIFLITLPKAGTTWLKALIFSILNRGKFPPAQSPLLTSIPHDVVPFFDFIIQDSKNPTLELEKIWENPDPRIFASHMPCSAYPKSVLDSNCRIVYLCRNPLDQFISYWHFLMPIFLEKKKLGDDEDAEPKIISIEKSFDEFCRGIHGYGPYVDHVLCHWKLSLEKPKKVLFMKYEDLKKDTKSCLIKIAEFLGCPFSEEERKKGVVGEIERLCSFETLKNLDVNKKGRRPSGVKNETFFRKGEVGDWKNYITPSMADHMKKLLEDKLGDSGLKFDM